MSSAPHDLNLDPADVEAAITPRTKALLVLHYARLPCAMDACRRARGAATGCVVIEDAAHAPGRELAGGCAERSAHVGCFSFFSNKNLPMGRAA